MLSFRGNTLLKPYMDARVLVSFKHVFKPLRPEPESFGCAGIVVIGRVSVLSLVLGLIKLALLTDVCHALNSANRKDVALTKKRAQEHPEYVVT